VIGNVKRLSMVLNHLLKLPPGKPRGLQKGGGRGLADRRSTMRMDKENGPWEGIRDKPYPTALTHESFSTKHYYCRLKNQYIYYVYGRALTNQFPLCKFLGRTPIYGAFVYAKEEKG
jgi:hypothetical protein